MQRETRLSPAPKVFVSIIPHVRDTHICHCFSPNYYDGYEFCVARQSYEFFIFLGERVAAMAVPAAAVPAPM